MDITGNGQGCIFHCPWSSDLGHWAVVCRKCPEFFLAASSNAAAASKALHSKGCFLYSSSACGPRNYSSISTWFWVLLPLLLTLPGPTLLYMSQGKYRDWDLWTGGNWWTDLTKDQTLIFLSFIPRILSEVALLGETSRCCFNQLQKKYILLYW